MFKKINKIHFVGIGGIGMSSIAEVLHGQGFTISGSDKCLSEITEHLSNLGIKVYEGHSAGNLGNPDVVVYSSAVVQDNPEVAEAVKRKIPIAKRSEMLAECMRFKYGIGVAGTHGKTTTTSMVGLSLIEAGLDPSIIVGGKLSALNGTNARLGNGEYIVVEADEYDRTFLQLNPVIAALTTLDVEHLDTYKDLEDIKKAFIQYANKVPFYGFVALSIDEPNLREIIPSIKKRIITYGLNNEAEVKAVNLAYDGPFTTFTVVHFGKELGSIKLNVPGNHNVKNSLAAVSIGIELGIEFNSIRKSLEAFTGAYRRFEIKYNKEIMLVDDYAHHPTEVTATLSAIRSGWNRRLVAVFQPHLYSRTKDFAEEFGKAFLNSDVFICTDVYPARETPIEGVTGELIANVTKDNGHSNVIYVRDKNDIPALLNEIKNDSDIIITMGAGDIYKFGQQFVETLKRLKD